MHLTPVQFTARLANALNGASLQLVELHLEQCDSCRSHLSMLGMQDDALAEGLRDDPGEAFLDEMVIETIEVIDEGMARRIAARLPDRSREREAPRAPIAPPVTAAMPPSDPAPAPASGPGAPDRARPEPAHEQPAAPPAADAADPWARLRAVLEPVAEPPAPPASPRAPALAEPARPRVDEAHAPDAGPPARPAHAPATRPPQPAPAPTRRGLPRTRRPGHPSSVSVAAVAILVVCALAGTWWWGARRAGGTPGSLPSAARPAAATESSPAEAATDPRPVTVTVPEAAAPGAEASPGDGRRSGILRGIVLDEEGQPVVAASVMLADVDSTVRTDRAGRFRVRVAGGERTLSVVCMGFRPAHLLVNVTDRSPELTVRLRSTSVPGAGASSR